MCRADKPHFLNIRTVWKSASLKLLEPLLSKSVQGLFYYYDTPGAFVHELQRGVALGLIRVVTEKIWLLLRSNMSGSCWT